MIENKNEYMMKLRKLDLEGKITILSATRVEIFLRFAVIFLRYGW